MAAEDEVEIAVELSHYGLPKLPVGASRPEHSCSLNQLFCVFCNIVAKEGEGRSQGW